MGYLCGLFFAFIVVVLVLAFVVGNFLPDRHTVARSQVIPQPPENIWAVISDHAQAPSWNPMVLSAEKQPDNDGNPVWLETYKNNQKMTLETKEFDPPRRLVRMITDVGLPFSGRWVYDIAQLKEGGSKVTITEHGEVKNPFFRLYARLIMSPTATIDKYLEALATKFGAPVNITS
jgi:uncharacterized protein YndB with AHSA1/START domain